MKKNSFFLSCIFIFFLSFSLYGEALKVEPPFFIPQEFFVGDIVEMKIPLKEVPFTFNFLWENQEESLGTFLEIKDIFYDEISSLISIIFTSYSPGKQVFPPLKISQGFELSGLSVNTLSLLEDKTTLFSFKKPILVSGTEALFIFLILLLFIFPWGLWKSFIFSKKYIRTRWQEHIYKKPYKRFLREMNTLKSFVDDSSSYSFFSHLDKVLRVYLGYRFDENFTTFTTKELTLYFKEKEEFSLKEKQLLLGVFKISDLVKFADFQVDPEERRRLRGEILVLIEKFETGEKK